MSRKKEGFCVETKIIMALSGKKQSARSYIYMNPKNAKRSYMYRKSRHFAKSKTIPVTFLFIKIKTLYITQFFTIFLKLAFMCIQKVLHFVLCDVFIFKKPDTSKKARQFALRFKYTKSLKLCVT